MWSLIIYKLIVCFCISLTYFRFANSFKDEFVIPTFNNETTMDISYYQNSLYLIDFFSWTVPLIVYLVWHKSKLIEIRLNQALLVCSFSSLITALCVFFNSFTLWIIVCNVQSILLSIAYWINLIEFFSLFVGNFLTPIGFYFTVTSLANLFVTYTVKLPVKWFYLNTCLLFFSLILLNKFKNIQSVNRIVRSDDFHTISIAFRGIRTSLAFVEIFCMSAIVMPLNLPPFMSTIDLMKTDIKRKTLINDKILFSFLLANNKAQDINLCSIGIFVGFLLISILGYIKINKVFIGFISKACILTYIIILLFQIEEPVLDLILFVGLSSNFSLRCNDIIKGFKRYLKLLGKNTEDDLLFLKAFCLLVISCLVGYVFGFSTMFVLTLFSGHLNVMLKAIGLLFYFIVIIMVTFESFDNQKEDDNFLLTRYMKREFVVRVNLSRSTTHDSSNNTTFLTNEKVSTRQQSHSSQQPSAPEKSGYHSVKERKACYNSNVDKYNNDQTNRRAFYTNDSNSILGDLSTSSFAVPSAPNAPSFFGNSGGSIFGSMQSSSYGGRSNDYNSNRSNNNSYRNGDNGSSNNGRTGRRREKQNTNNNDTPPQLQQETIATTTNTAEDDWQD